MNDFLVLGYHPLFLIKFIEDNRHDPILDITYIRYIQYTTLLYRKTAGGIPIMGLPLVRTIHCI